MKLLNVCAVLLAACVLGGCLDTTNTSCNCPKDKPAGVKQSKADNCGECNTVININGSQTPTQSAVVQTGYQTVYTTEYGPCGPVVKKAMIPVYSTAPVMQPSVLCPAPVSYGAPCPPIMNNPVQPCLPIIPNCPPAQPANPAVAEPVGWFGPSGTPNFTRQTNWF